jgi:hypothetical protein
MENHNLTIVQNRETSLSNRQPQSNWTTSLVNILPTSSGLTLTDAESTGIAMSLTKLNFEVALQSEKLFQLKNTIGQENIFKSVCALLKMFSDATKVNKPLSSSEIIMCTDWIIKKYTHESIADFALALKDGIFGGHKFYGSVTIADVKEVIEKYFELKAEKLREIHENLKNSNTDTGDTIISSLVETYKSVYNDSFKEVLDREKRALVQKNIDIWREKMKTPDFRNQFEQFEQYNQPLENDNHSEETPHILQGQEAS